MPTTPNTKILAVSLVILGLLGDPYASVARAEVCGDADGSGTVTVSDGVNVLRAAAGLPAECPTESCDVDASGAISVSDGVNVLRAAAALPASLACVADPIISSVVGQDGVFGKLVKAPGGLQAPTGARQTITGVDLGDGFVPGRANTVTVRYDVSGTAHAQGAQAGSSLFIASQPEGADPEDGFFDLPLAEAEGEATITLDVKPNVAVQRFTLKLTTGEDGAVVGEVSTLIIFVVGASSPECGNRVIDPDETCDPPGFGCPAFGGGFCNTACVCDELVRFVDNDDGTVTDTQTGLQWERKTGSPGPLRDCTLASCPDPHDVNNTYQWCADADHADFCDTAGNPPDGVLFTNFLAALNSPPCFAGHCDWRLPTVNRVGDSAELETIVNLKIPGCGNNTTACIDPIFGPTNPHSYWSGTTRAGNPGDALGVSFFNGAIIDEYKSDDLYVRAVRGGP